MHEARYQNTGVGVAITAADISHLTRGMDCYAGCITHNKCTINISQWWTMVLDECMSIPAHPWGGRKVRCFPTIYSTPWLRGTLGCFIDWHRTYFLEGRFHFHCLVEGECSCWFICYICSTLNVVDRAILGHRCFSQSKCSTSLSQCYDWLLRVVWCMGIYVEHWLANLLHMWDTLVSNAGRV